MLGALIDNLTMEDVSRCITSQADGNPKDLGGLLQKWVKKKKKKGILVLIDTDEN